LIHSRDKHARQEAASSSPLTTCYNGRGSICHKEVVQFWRKTLFNIASNIHLCIVKQLHETFCQKTGAADGIRLVQRAPPQKRGLLRAAAQPTFRRFGVCLSEWLAAAASCWSPPRDEMTLYFWLGDSAALVNGERTSYTTARRATMEDNH
jgi:hypothetical protein